MHTMRAQLTTPISAPLSLSLPSPLFSSLPPSRRLIVVGSADTLRHDALWSQWLEWCEEHSVIRDKSVWQDLVWHAIRNALR